MHSGSGIQRKTHPSVDTCTAGERTAEGVAKVQSDVLHDTEGNSSRHRPGGWGGGLGNEHTQSMAPSFRVHRGWTLIGLESANSVHSLSRTGRVWIDCGCGEEKLQPSACIVARPSGTATWLGSQGSKYKSQDGRRGRGLKLSKSARSLFSAARGAAGGLLFCRCRWRGRLFRGSGGKRWKQSMQRGLFGPFSRAKHSICDAIAFRHMFNSARSRFS